MGPQVLYLVVVVTCVLCFCVTSPDAGVRVTKSSPTVPSGPTSSTSLGQSARPENAPLASRARAWAAAAPDTTAGFGYRASTARSVTPVASAKKSF